MTYTGISLVTGATGLLGRHLVAHLMGRGVKVRAAALPSEDSRALAQLGAEVVRADLTAPDTLAPLYPDFAASMREIGQRFREGTLA